MDLWRELIAGYFQILGSPRNRDKARSEGSEEWGLTLTWADGMTSGHIRRWKPWLLHMMHPATRFVQHKGPPIQGCDLVTDVLDDCISRGISAPTGMGTMGDPMVMTGVILDIARRAFENEALQSSDVISNFSSDTRKIIQIVRDAKADTGIELPINAFATSASISDIGRLSTGAKEPLPLLVQLKCGTGTPIFLLPGVSGTVVELRPMAAAFTVDNPVYALAYPGLDGASEPMESIEELGKLMHQEIRKAAPRGPVHLLGYSAGGCIAVEVARLLGPQDTGFVGLVEAPIHLRHWPLGVWLRFIFKGPQRSLTVGGKPAPASTATSKPTALPQKVAPRREVAGGRLAIALDKVHCVVYQRYGSIADQSFLKSFMFRVDNLPSRIQAVRDATIRAMAYAAPARYDGPATYYKTEGGDGLMCEPSVVWKPILPNVQFHAVPGRHGSILAQPHVAFLARHVSEKIRAKELDFAEAEPVHA